MNVWTTLVLILSVFICIVVPVGKNSKEEENIDLANEMAKESKDFIDSVLVDVSKVSATEQLVLGSVSGWCTGYLSMKVGKVVAVALSGGIILFLYANHQGYIKINWDKVYKDVDEVTGKIKEKASAEGPKWMDKAHKFARDNTYLAAGFLGGVLLGMASS